MRELKGDWKDLFNGFMLALDLRKMFLAFAGLVFTVLVSGLMTALFASFHDLDAVRRTWPGTLALHELWNSLTTWWDLLYFHSYHMEGSTYPNSPTWYLYIPYTFLFLVTVFAIWAYFGGAIARIAAYEIAKDGERIETTRAMKFAGRKFWSFFFAPVICIVGFLFFFFCNYAVGFLGKFLDFLYFGGPLLAVFLPLALLAGFIMMLITVGSFSGLPLFTPAVAAEGTDSFDAVSRGFSYVYSRPWHFIGYQLTSVVYGVFCISFVFLFAVGMSDLGVRAGAAGYDAWHSLYNRSDGEPADKFEDIRHAAWSKILSERHNKDNLYSWNPYDMATGPHPYGRTMWLANQIVQPNFQRGRATATHNDRWHVATKWIVFFWLLVVVGHAYGYIVSYFISQQTMIYFVLRKKVDGIEMNEVFEEAEEEEPLPEPPPPPAETKEEPEKAPAKKTTQSGKKAPTKGSRRKSSPSGRSRRKKKE